LCGRFLELYDELNDMDLKLYFEIIQNMYKTILNFNIQEDDDNIYIPLPRALDYFRLMFATRLTNSSL
jgi:hypothetical protein